MLFNQTPNSQSYECLGVDLYISEKKGSMWKNQAIDHRVTIIDN